ncbi:MAG: acetyl-CoA carboxylase carboxyltransferase subunit beta [Alphaproteobacteria bacterium]|nr:acetyl-CoA carboxylase carboxyltransferase subunit beta [Alphaproteobacteria bacterium]
MNWLANLIPPRIRSFVGEQKEVPDNLWQKCPGCEAMLFHRDLAANHNVCYHCGHHLRLSVKERLKLMYDDGKYSELPMPQVEQDPLKFKDRKRYVDRIKEAQSKTGLKEAITVVCGTMGGMSVVTAVFNFSYMGGSMGVAVGEAIVSAAEFAVQKKAAFIIIPASGGARMQEGMLSLIQMPRTIAAIEMVKEAMLPYIVILSDPTTGGVSASFAMVGDIHIAEPGATIGFAGRRVIEETVREILPPDFQTAEYLLEHGMVDMVVPRSKIKETLVNIIGILTKKAVCETKPGGGNGGKRKNNGQNGRGSKAAEKTGKNGKQENTSEPTKTKASINETKTKYSKVSSQARTAQSSAKAAVKQDARECESVVEEKTKETALAGKR